MTNGGVFAICTAFCFTGFACFGYGYLFNRRKMVLLRTSPDGSSVTTRQELLDCMMDASFLKFQIKSLGIVKLPKVYMKLKGRVVPFSRRASNLQQDQQHPHNQDNRNDSESNVNMIDVKSSAKSSMASKTTVLHKSSQGSVSISPWALELVDGTRIQVFDSEFADLDIMLVNKDQDQVLVSQETVMILGLVQMDTDGILKISRPSFSWQWFFISTRDENVLLRQFYMYWRLWVSAGVAFEVLSILILLAFRRKIN